jgi:hypothetical protein
MGFIAGAYCYRYRIIRRQKRAANARWSIGIYTGASPFALGSPENIKNPVLTARDVTDVVADFVADPFLVRDESLWYMFFEVLNAETKRGEIAVAISLDGYRFTYKQVVLREPFHLSYPHVFRWENSYYMIPESHEAYSVRLYRATVFPTKWAHVCDLLRGNCCDTTVFRHMDKWWLFTSDRNDVLRLYGAPDVRGPWAEHPKSPLIVGNAHVARCAGRILQTDGRLIRFAQDCAPIYGNQVHAFEITSLSDTEYEERPATDGPILKASGTGWNARGMHQIDVQEIRKGEWIASVDGFGDPHTPVRADALAARKSEN